LAEPFWVLDEGLTRLPILTAIQRIDFDLTRCVTHFLCMGTTSGSQSASLRFKHFNVLAQNLNLPYGLFTQISQRIILELFEAFTKGGSVV